jgi:hypothetical protein
MEHRRSRHQHTPENPRACCGVMKWQIFRIGVRECNGCVQSKKGDHMNRYTVTSDWLAVVNLPMLVLCAWVIVPNVGWSANNFPACPTWIHSLTFVNTGISTVHVKETPGCFANSIGQPPFNGTRCWPFQAGGGFDLKPGVANAVTVKMTSCWSGNFGITCASCKGGVQTLAEFTFDGGLDAAGKKLPGLLDTYDVSLVDGFTKR